MNERKPADTTKATNSHPHIGSTGFLSRYRESCSSSASATDTADEAAGRGKALGWEPLRERSSLM